MHTFIILGDDIYTLDTAEERTLAAAHMRDAGVERCSVYRGGPDGNQDPEGRDFCSDGTWAYDGHDETMARMTAAYRGELDAPADDADEAASVAGLMGDTSFEWEE